MNRIFVVSILVFFTLTLAVGSTAAQGPGPAVPQTPLGAGFTYQGQLKNVNGPVNGTCDFQFSLWNAAGSGTPPTGGAQLGATQSLTAGVSNGLFTVVLNDAGQFGASAFTGEARWLQIAVRCPNGSGTYTTLSPRQTLTATPYALFASGNWGLTGNNGTTARNFLGTTDKMTLTLGVSNTEALRLVPAPSAPIIIGGYSGNTVGGLGDGATIAGGGSSTFGANVITGTNVTWATIGGGVDNQISGTAYQSTIGGGLGNQITVNAPYGTISGGANNTISGDALNSTIGGGNQNSVTGAEATIGGGIDNIASGTGAFIGGGGWNGSTSGGNQALGGGSTVGGGIGNTASGLDATVPGGALNTAQGEASLAAGTHAQALHNGTFVWGDWTGADFASTGDNQFLIRANGGVGINTNVPTRTLDVNGVIGVFDSGTRTYYGGLASEVNGQLVELGVNDSFLNRFGGAYDSAAQGGLFRVDARGGENLFQFLGRPAGSTSSITALAALNSSGVLTINGLGSAGATALCRNASNQISTCSSSLRYKSNIHDLGPGLDMIAKLRPVTFNWTTNGEADLGFVAEEVNQVWPVLTTLNQDGQIEGVKYDRISAILVKAMQEQQQQIAELKAQNAAQQQAIAQLKNGTASELPVNVFNVISVIALVGVIAMGLHRRRGGQA